MPTSKENMSIIRISRLVVVRGTIAAYVKQIRCLAGYSFWNIEADGTCTDRDPAFLMYKACEPGLSDSQLLYLSPAPVVTESWAVLLTGL